MANDQHPMERRSALLAERLAKNVEMMSTMMRPDGRAIYHTRLPEDKALSWWRRHRFDDLGKAVMSTWKPDRILALDQRLAQDNEMMGMGGIPSA